MEKFCTNDACLCVPNQNIHCSVDRCAYHCQGSDFCGLSEIRIGTHEPNPTQPECTDCESFRLK